jgi:hypothetical protein
MFSFLIYFIKIKMPSIKKCTNNSDCEKLNRFRTKNKYFCDLEKKICTKQKKYSVSYLPEKNIVHYYKQSPTEAFLTKIIYFNSVSNRYLLKIDRINITDLKKLIASHFSIIKEIDKFYDIPQSSRTTGSPKALGSSGSPKALGSSGSPRASGSSGSPKALGSSGSPRASGSSGSPRTSGSSGASPQELSEIKNMRANITANKKHFEDALVYKTKMEQTQRKLVEKNVREIMTSISEQLRKLIVNPVDWGNLDWYQRFKQIKTVVNDNKFVEIPDNVRLLLR